jgi:hypothetical protein
LKKLFLYTFLLIGLFAFSRAGSGGGSHGGSGGHFSGGGYHSYGNHHNGHGSYYHEPRPLTHNEIITLLIVGSGLFLAILLYAGYITYLHFFKGKINKNKIRSRFEKDAFWDHDQLLAEAAASYIEFQQAWSKADLTTVRDKLSLRFYRHYTGILNRYKKNGVLNIVEEVVIKDSSVIYFDDYDDNSKDVIAILMSGEMKDYFSRSGRDETILKKEFKDACVFHRKNNRLILDEIINEPDFYRVIKPKNYIETT